MLLNWDRVRSFTPRLLRYRGGRLSGSASLAILVLIFLCSFVPAVVPSRTGKSLRGGVDLHAACRRPAQLIKADSGRESPAPFALRLPDSKRGRSVSMRHVRAL